MPGGCVENHSVTFTSDFSSMSVSLTELEPFLWLQKLIRLVGGALGSVDGRCVLLV